MPKPKKPRQMKAYLTKEEKATVDRNMAIKSKSVAKSPMKLTNPKTTSGSANSAMRARQNMIKNLGG